MKSMKWLFPSRYCEVERALAQMFQKAGMLKVVKIS